MTLQISGNRILYSHQESSSGSASGVGLHVHARVLTHYFPTIRGGSLQLTTISSKVCPFHHERCVKIKDNVLIPYTPLPSLRQSGSRTAQETLDSRHCYLRQSILELALYSPASDMEVSAAISRLWCSQLSSKLPPNHGYCCTCDASSSGGGPGQRSRTDSDMVD